MPNRMPGRTLPAGRGPAFTAGLALALAAGLALAFAACAGPEDAEAPDGTTEILWDRYGIPHLFAADDAGLFFAFGWAQMRAHGDLLLRLYGSARGRAAEYWGEEHLDSDRWVHTVGIPGRAARWHDAQDDEQRRFLEAFVAGVNAYAERHPERIADELEVVLPIRPEDPLAHSQFIIHFTFVASAQGVQGAVRRWSQHASAELGPLGLPPSMGSNAWAIGPGRSGSGAAMLLANPHLPWDERFVWFEAQLSSPSVDAYGATLVGSPFLSIAFNDHLGWTHTVNTLDGADLYELELAEGGYRWDGAVRAFETRTAELAVRRPDGSRGREALTIRESVHGPVVAEDAGRALALRVAGLDEPHIGRQYWDMLRATDLQEFEAAVSRLQMPMFTVMYADREGHILHLFGGRTPVRPAGDWNWSGIVPGDRSATLWTETHPYEDLPRVLDPASGWLQNANDPPWTTTFPAALNPESYPAYLAPRGMGLRPQRSARMLAEDASVTFEEFLAYKHSTRLELADRLLDDLLPRARAAGGEAARAASVLEAWDRQTDAGSRGAVLFTEFWQRARRTGGGAWGPFARPWDPAAPLETPDGLADPEAAVAALAEAARHVETAWGALDVAWGDLHRLRRDGLDLPANGGAGSYGIFRVVAYDDDGDGKRRAAFGDSYVAAIEFGEETRAQSLIGYGNWSQTGSRHRTDQLELFARKELRPVWRARPEVEANLAEREWPGAP